MSVHENMEDPRDNLLESSPSKASKGPPDIANHHATARNGSTVICETGFETISTEEKTKGQWPLFVDSCHSLALAGDVEPATQTKDDEVPPDGGYGWVVVVAALLLNMLASGLFMIYGVYLPDLTQYFQKSQASMAIFMSVESVVLCIAMFFVPWMIRSLGDRTVGIIGVLIAGLGTLASAFSDGYVVFVLTFGVIRTIGSALMILPPNMAVQKYFRRRRALAAGISSMGLSGGALCFSPLQRLLIDTFGWRGSLLLFSAFVFQGLVLAALLRPLNPSTMTAASTKFEMKTETKGSGKIHKNKRRLKSLDAFLGLSVLSDKWVMLFIAAKCCTVCGMVGMYKYAVSNAVYHGIDTMKASLLPSMLGLGSSISRLLGSTIGNLPSMRHRRLLVYGIGNVLNAMVLFVASFAQESYTYHAVSCLAFGLAIGSHEGLAMTVIADLFGISRMAKVASWVTGVPGVSLCLILPLMGYLCDVTGTLRASMLLAGGIHTAGGFIFLTLLIPSHKVRSWDIQHGMIQEQKNMEGKS